MGEDAVSQVIAGGVGLGLIGIAMRQLWPILELNRQAAIDWKGERKDLNARIDALETRVAKSEKHAEAAEHKANVAIGRAEECERREEGLRQQIADLRT